MSAVRSLCVAVTIGDPPRARWHRLVIDAVQAETTDVLVSRSVPASPNLDVVIDLVGDPIVSAPAFGVWRYGFGDGAPAADGARGTLARVYRPGRDPSRATVLREGWFRGVSDDAPGVDAVGDWVAPWCGLLLRQLAMDPAALDDAPVQPLAGCDCPLPSPAYRGPLVSMRDAVSRWRRRERWTIGLARTSIDDILASGDLAEPRWLSGVSNDSYLADPFPVSADGDRVSLVAEEFRYHEGRGRIVRLDVGRDGHVGSTRAVFDAPHHLAYPFIVRDGGTVYCVPDGSAAGRVSAYALGSPDDTCMMLLDFPAVDPTIVEHAGRWWLFCTRRGLENQTNLYVFEADTWRGPWRPHRLNPVKTDARSSRPAGSFFRRSGVLFRPAQDCSRRYGGAIAINQIVALSSNAFREETVCMLTPSASWQWPDGMHTLNTIDDLVIVDALRVER